MIYTITARNDGRQLREYLSTELALSRRIITRLKKNERGILQNGCRVTVRAVLHEGDTVFLALEDCETDVNEGIEGSKDADSFILPRILYEDGDIMALNKPCNMPTHPSRNHLSDSLANEVCGYFADKGVPFVFRPVNRLDSGTSGAVLIAKNQRAAKLLSEQLISGRVKKSYIALLDGKMYPRKAVRGERIFVSGMVCCDDMSDGVNTKCDGNAKIDGNGECAGNTGIDGYNDIADITRKIFGDGELAEKILANRLPYEVSGEIKTNIRRKKESIIEREVTFESDGADNSAACTKYRIIAQNERATLVLAEPVTGRTHQLRVHFAHTGHNIIGDTMYLAKNGDSEGADECVSEKGTQEHTLKDETIAADTLKEAATDEYKAEEYEAETSKAEITRQALHAAILEFDALRDPAYEQSVSEACGLSGAKARLAAEKSDRITVYAPVADDIIRLAEVYFTAPSTDVENKNI